MRPERERPEPAGWGWEIVTGKQPKRRIESQRISAEITELRALIEQPCDAAQYRVLRRLAANPDTHLAISFGGGSVPALAANTALAALLEELDLRPHVREIWGTSAGAVTGAGWASGCNTAEMLERLEQLNWPGALDFSRWDFISRSLLGLTRWGRLPEGLIAGRHYRESIEAGLKVATFEECAIPFRAIACTDDGRARKVIFRKGPLVNAIMASMCLPGVLRPVQDWNGEPYGYFDGGIVEKTPLLSIIDEHTRQMRPGRLLVICTHFTLTDRRQTPRSFLQRFISATLHMGDLIWEAQMERARAAPGCKFIVLNPHLQEGSDFDFSYIRNNYLAARQQFKEQLSNAGLGKRFDAR